MFREHCMNPMKLLITALVSLVLLVSLGCRSSRVQTGTEAPIAMPSVQFPYPNPFSPTTLLNIDVPGCMPVRITVFNVDGDTLGVPLDSTICGHLDFNWWDSRVVMNSRTGLPDTLWRRPGTSGLYMFHVEFPDTTIVGKQLLLL